MKLSEKIKTGKLSALIATFAACALSGASAVETDTYYTVTVDSGTYSAPVSLETLDVTVEKEGEATETKSFAEVWSDFASGPAIFRKRGTGWMMSSTKMAAFTGEIRIEEGAFMVNTNLMTGPLNPTTAPTVVISNGASFVLATTAATCPSGNGSYTGGDPGLHLCNHFHLNGEGVDNLGAIANCLGNNQQYCFYGPWTLDGDALLCGRSNCRYDLSGNPSVTMNGHTLTVKRAVTDVTWSFCAGSALFKNGHIVVDHTHMQPQGGGSSVAWSGDASHTLTLTNYATIGYYNTNLTIPWSLVMTAGTAFYIGGSAGSRSDYGSPTDTYGRWDGPLVANGSVRIAGSGENKGLILRGPLQGSGPVIVGSGWLQMLAESPDYKGAICVREKDPSYPARNSGLALFSASIYSEDAAGIAFTNAELRLASQEAFRLPTISAHVGANTNYTFSGGGEATRFASLVKTGEGELYVATPASITGRLELAGGILRMAPVERKQFYSLAGGLWREVAPQPENSTYDAYMNSDAYCSNEVTRCCENLLCPTYPPWKKYTTYAWGGYIWNRSETSETWRFALGASGYSRLWLDGTRIMSTDDNGNVSFYNKTMTPGPHSFLLKVNPRNYGHPGSVGAKPTKNKDWKSGTMGLAVSLTSTTSTNSDDFVFMENGLASAAYPGGDGYWFTRDTRDVGDFDADELEVASKGRHLVSNAVCRAGTLLDLGEGNEVPLYVPRFEGVTTVTNGGLTVAESWKLRPEDVAGGGLKVYGELKFKAGTALLWEDLSQLPRKPEKVLATATGGIDGMPAWNAPDLASSRWRLAKAKDAAGNDILTFTWAAGTTIIMR